MDVEVARAPVRQHRLEPAGGELVLDREGRQADDAQALERRRQEHDRIVRDETKPRSHLFDRVAFGTIDTWQHMYEFERHHVGPGGMANGKRHLAMNVAIEPVSATEAHVTNDLIVLEIAEVPHVVASGRYDRSVVVKTAQGWRFKRRTLKVDGGFFKR